MTIEIFKKYLIFCEDSDTAKRVYQTLNRKCRDSGYFNDILLCRDITSFKQNDKDIIKIEYTNYTTYVHVYIYDTGEFKADLSLSDFEEDLLDEAWSCGEFFLGSK